MQRYDVLPGQGISRRMSLIWPEDGYTGVRCECGTWDQWPDTDRAGQLKLWALDHIKRHHGAGGELFGELT